MGPKGGQILGVLFNEQAALLLPEFLRKYRPSFPVGHASPAEVYGYLGLTFMRQWYVPMMAFIDRKGAIRAQFTGTDAFFKANEEANVRGMIESLLKETGVAGGASKKKK